MPREVILPHHASAIIASRHDIFPTFALGLGGIGVMVNAMSNEFLLLREALRLSSLKAMWTFVGSRVVLLMLSGWCQRSAQLFWFRRDLFP